MQNVLISACLLGVSCRYDGKVVKRVNIEGLKRKFCLIPICPEVYGGLPTPREPSERVEDRVMTKSGVDVTAQYLRGAQIALQYARLFGCKMAILKERSPSCGSIHIYDGTFTGKLRVADGVTTELLLQNGIRVFGESQIPQLLGEK